MGAGEATTCLRVESTGNRCLNFSDPFGLCPICAVAYGIFEVASTIYDVGDLAVTGVKYLGGRASGQELAVTAGGAALGLVSFGGGAGRAGRLALNRALGEAGEAAVAASTGLVKNTTARLGSRIPDFVDAASGAFHEVKNVASLSYTKQLREMVQNLGEGQKLIIHVRENTRLSRSFDNLTNVEIVRDLPR